MNDSIKADKLYKISTYEGDLPFQAQIVENEIECPLFDIAEAFTKTRWSRGSFSYIENYKTPKGELLATGKYRSIDTFVSMHLLVYDHDEGLTLLEASSLLGNMGVAHYLVPARCHQKRMGKKPPCDRFRIVMPLSREITSKEEYYVMWKHFAEIFADPANRQGDLLMTQ
jgi:hypothetical protein